MDVRYERRQCRQCEYLVHRCELEVNCGGGGFLGLIDGRWKMLRFLSCGRDCGIYRDMFVEYCYFAIAKVALRLSHVAHTKNLVSADLWI